MRDRPDPGRESGLEIAVVGMALRFPGANEPARFWENLRGGVESITFFSEEELDAAGIAAAEYRSPNYVKAAGVLDDIDLFDAAFFGFTPREAEVLDPQHRLFLECAWEALEAAGLNPETYPGLVGVFGGVGVNTYYLHHLLVERNALSKVDGFQVGISNDKDSLTSRVAYKLGLGGPSVTIQSACSTSLVATHLACQSLLSGECDVVMAGGVTVVANQSAGYLYEEGGILSPDGHCRSFDAHARGTVGGSGVGIVVLKRLQDAQDDGDHIHALILGSAVNNDGSRRVGFTAPGLEGQARVIRAAHMTAGVSPATIGYVEAHGTATTLGDPIEIGGLTRAFRMGTDRTGYCAVGSVKSNIGHIDAASGVAGLIKAVLALENREIPPSLHFEEPNPDIDFVSSPFYVNNKRTAWDTDGLPRRAGVSSFGLGGTNAHVVLEEAPPAAQSEIRRSTVILPISAKTPSSLDAATTGLGRYLRGHPDLSLADVAHTLQVGRRTFDHRRVLVCEERTEAADVLEGRRTGRLIDSVEEMRDRPVLYMFPGGGAQYPGMGAGLYRHEPVFREAIDRCGELVESQLEFRLDSLIFDEADPVATDRLRRPALALPALFATEYALARLWSAVGVEPAAMIGHSLGEYVAACLAGVMALPDALTLVVARGRLMETMPPGGMLSVPLAEDDVRRLVGQDLSVAAVNGPTDCVVSGSAAQVDAAERSFEREGIPHQRLHIDVAAHSSLVSTILPEFEAFLDAVELQEPLIPYVSNLTGTWTTAAQVTDRQYWLRHLRETVRFADGLRTLAAGQPDAAFLEVGPGQTLTMLAGRMAGGTETTKTVTSIRHPRDQRSDEDFFSTAVGRLWLAGVELDWAGLWGPDRPRRTRLPPYAFERQRFWVEPGPTGRGGDVVRPNLERRSDVAEFFYIPSWRRTVPPPAAIEPYERRRFLVFLDDMGLGEGLADRLREMGHGVVTAAEAPRFARSVDGSFDVRPGEEQDYQKMVGALEDCGHLPDVVLHLWNVVDDNVEPDGADRRLERGYFSLLYLVRAIAESPAADVRITVLANHLQRVVDADPVVPEKAMMIGLGRVAAQEIAGLGCSFVDVAATLRSTHSDEWVGDQVLAEVLANPSSSVVAYRGRQRWVQEFQPARLEDSGPAPLRTKGVYLVTGGLGRVARVIARHLAARFQARLVLTTRRSLPPKDEWHTWPERGGGDDPVTAAIRYVRELEAWGAEVLVVDADVADASRMAKAVDLTYERFGALHGVVHTAAVTSGPSIRSQLQAIDRAGSDLQFRPKVDGLYVLEAALRGKPIDFCALISSNASILGGLGFGAYAAANAFMDAFAASRSGHTPWISSNWDGWPTEEAEEQAGVVNSSIDSYGLTPDEAVTAFERVLAARVEQVSVSAADLRSRLDLWVDGPLTGRESTGSPVEDRRLHPRPAVQSSFVGPRTGTERAIGVIWSDLLGIEVVGVNDNFFELGGHSLLAAQIMSRARSDLAVELPLESFFVDPTISGLAALVDDELARSGGPSDREVQRLLSEIDAMSDAEVEEALGEDAATPRSEGDA